MRAEGGSPNIINGVSRQSPEVRLPSQLQESVNQFPTVTRGLVPRNPAVLKGRVSGAPAANSKFHIIDRDEAERYVVRISPSGIVVHDFAGTAKTVATPNGVGYLSGASADDYEALTVADHTFIVNKKKVVAEGSATSPALEKSVLFHIPAGENDTIYAITINGVEVASYKTPGGPYTDQDARMQGDTMSKASSIAYGLANGAPVQPYRQANGSLSWGDPKITGGLNTLGAGWSVTLMDNVIYVKNTAGTDFTVSVSASGKEEVFRAHKGIVKDFSDLPRKAPDGFTIKVVGSKDTDFDDYWVKFSKGANDGLGHWIETVGPGIPLSMDKATMPHILVREANGTFTFKQALWADREAGDLETNPWPSFVGTAIQGLGFARNRLCLLAGETPVWSRAGEFFNFFIETIQTALDTDPVDAAISYEKVSTVYHAVSVAGQTVIFTKSVPFRLKTGEVFSQKVAAYEPALANQSSPKVRPVASGSRLFFVNDTPSGSFVHEFVNLQDEFLTEAPTINEHCMGYVPGNVTKMTAHEDLKMLALVSSSEPSTIYTYKWLYLGQDKAQSAWQKWTLKGTIRDLEFVGEELVVVTEVDTGIEHLGIPCHEAWDDDKPAILLLDRRVTRTGTYSSVTGNTTFTTPYPALGASALIADATDFGFAPTVVSDTGTSLVVAGNYAGKSVYIGFEYEAWGELSQFVLRQKSRDGGEGNAIPGVNVKVASMRFDTGPSVGLKVDLQRAYRPTYTYNLSAALVGTKTSPLGSLVVGKLAKSLSVLAAAEDVTIRFSNLGPYPYHLISFRWTGGAYPKGY